MNKKGQSLIVFVMILPLIIFFIAFFIDSSRMILENNRVKEIVKDNIKLSLEKDIRDKEKIEKTLENNQDVEASVYINNNELQIEASSKKKNIFGNIFKIKWLKQTIKYCGNYTNKSIKEC